MFEGFSFNEGDCFPRRAHDFQHFIPSHADTQRQAMFVVRQQLPSAAGRRKKKRRGESHGPQSTIPNSRR